MEQHCRMKSSVIQLIKTLGPPKIFTTKFIPGATEAEEEIIDTILNGAGILKQIAEHLELNEKTIKCRLYSLYKLVENNGYQFKTYSPQVLKANMRIVGNTEYALLFYRDKLPKFNNNGQMVFNSMPMNKDTVTPKIHPTQKSIFILKRLISLFTDVNDVVIDPCAGSGSTLLAAKQLNRRAYGFEIKKEFVNAFYSELNPAVQNDLFSYAM